MTRSGTGPIPGDMRQGQSGVEIYTASGWQPATGPSPAPWKYLPSPGSLQSIQSGHPIDVTKNLVINTSKGDIILNLSTGDITFPVGLSRDEAIRDFWFGFQKHFPCGNDEHYERSIKLLENELKKQKQKADEYGEYAVKETRKRIAEMIADKYKGEKFIMVRPEDLIKFIEGKK